MNCRLLDDRWPRFTSGSFAQSREFALLERWSERPNISCTT